MNKIFLRLITCFFPLAVLFLSPVISAGETDGPLYYDGQFKHLLPKTGSKTFKNLGAVAIGPDGTIYAADSKNDWIGKFDKSGNLIKKWGGSGEGDGRFEYSWGLSGIAVGPGGFVYTNDMEGSRIQKFDADGNFITKWGGPGTANGQFSSGRLKLGIAVGHNGEVYIADTGNNRIQKFDSNGKFITKWGGRGTGDGQFNYPNGIAIAPDGTIYVADSGNSRIQEFDANGNFLRKLGEFQWQPKGIAIGTDNSVYITSDGPPCLQKFDLDGHFIKKWCWLGVRGPSGMAVGPDGAVYMADWLGAGLLKMSMPAKKTLKAQAYPKPSQIPMITCSGTVVDELGRRLQGVKVTLSQVLNDGGEKTVGTAYTRKDGTFSVKGEAGYCAVDFEKAGYEEASGGYGETSIMKKITSSNDLATLGSYTGKALDRGVLDLLASTEFNNPWDQALLEKIGAMYNKLEPSLIKAVNNEHVKYQAMSIISIFSDLETISKLPPSAFEQDSRQQNIFLTGRLVGKLNPAEWDLLKRDSYLEYLTGYPLIQRTAKIVMALNKSGLLGGNKDIKNLINNLSKLAASAAAARPFDHVRQSVPEYIGKDRAFAKIDVRIGSQILQFQFLLHEKEGRWFPEGSWYVGMIVID